MNKKVSRTKKSHQPFYKRKSFWWPVGSILGLVLVTLLAFRLSPWPGALVIRAVFNDDSAKVKQALEKHQPIKSVVRLENQSYLPGDKDAVLDIYHPQDIAATTRLPVIIWTHGGAWLSGSKDNYVPYFKLLAAEGFTVVAPNYSLAPGATYPKALYQLTVAHKYIKANAARFRVDTNKIFLAGDSAGSQFSSQLAAIMTNPSYAKEVGIAPGLSHEQLLGVILFCGIYKMEGLAHPDPTLPKIVGWGDDVSVWAYSGTSDFSDPVIRQMSPYYHVTKDFPATFISGGNADPLTDAQSKPLAEKLRSLGVSVETLFYPADHQPRLLHEYQFNLDNQDGRKALEKTVEFIKSRLMTWRGE